MTAIPEVISRAVAGYFEVLNGADPELLREVLSDDFTDEDPLAWEAGLDAVIERVRLYRAALPDARSEVEAIEARGSGATVIWVTAATGLDGSESRVSYRYRAEMEMRGARIRSHRVLSVEPVSPLLLRDCEG